MSKTASTLIDDLLVLECLFQMDLRFGSKRMIRWHDDYKILFGDRDKFNQWFIIDFGTEADIIFLFFYAFQNLICDYFIAVQSKVDLFSLIFIQKATQDPGNKVTSQSSQKGNINVPLSFSGKL